MLMATMDGDPDGGAPLNSDPMQRLFVYGSLQPGGSNAHVLASVEGEWQRAMIRGRLFAEGWGADMGYPGLVVDEAGEDVPGWVLSSTQLDAEWTTLDDFEGEEYERVRASVTLRSGEQVRAHVYVIRRPTRGLR